MSRIRVILFDLDGVLIEAKEWHYEALNNALSIFGMEISRYDHLITYDGLPTKKKLEMLSIERGLPKELHKFINELKQKYTHEIIYNRCKPSFTHQYCLSKLKSEGFKIGVCSNSIRKSVQIMLEKAKLLEYVDFYLSNEDVKNSKPDPEIYFQAFKLLYSKPDECLIIEDNEKGLEAAKKSGAFYLKVGSTTEVNYDNIIRTIQEIENGRD